MTNYGEHVSNITNCEEHVSNMNKRGEDVTPSYHEFHGRFLGGSCPQYQDVDF